jgi:hypothetical protein
VYTGPVNPLGVPMTHPSVGRPTPPAHPFGRGPIVGPEAGNPQVGRPVILGPSPERPQIWECPSGCDAAARTVDHKIPYHPCPEQNGVMVPLVHRGTKAHHRLIERPDYVGADAGGVQPVEDKRGRLVMAVETHTDDGYSTTVFAPAATVTDDEYNDAKGSAGGQ